MHALCEAQNSMQKRCQRDWKDHELRPRPCFDDGVDAKTWEVRAVRSQVDLQHSIACGANASSAAFFAMLGVRC